MSQAETEATESTPLGADDDIEKLLAERQRLEAAFEEKFKRAISVMFTDLKGSTAITEKVGDLAARDLMKRHNDIFFPIVEKNGGVVVKTMGDGTMSYFNTAQEAARTAVAFQKAWPNTTWASRKFPSKSPSASTPASASWKKTTFTATW